MNAGGKGKVLEDAPMEFVGAKWRPYMTDADGRIIRKYYELCAPWELRGTLRSGDVWLNGRTNAVIACNPVSMDEAIRQLREEGYEVSDRDLAHLSPALCYCPLVVHPLYTGHSGYGCHP